ncbi:beta-defensin 35-like [Callospermophilus lateralis]
MEEKPALFPDLITVVWSEWPGKPSQPLFLGTGEFAVCETCRLGRGKCRKICLEDEKIYGNCRLNFFCCRPKILR